MISNKDSMKKLVISSVVLVVFILIITLISTHGLNLGIIKISSIKTILGQYSQIKSSEDSLNSKMSAYTSAVQSLETAKSDYSKQKAMYSAISDETIKIIKDATTAEKYDIEYIWVKLGNYAKENNLSIVLVEPGGSEPVATTNNTSSTSGTNSTSSTNQGSSTNTGTVKTQQFDASGSSSTVSSNSSSTQNTVTSDANKTTNTANTNTSTTTGTNANTSNTTNTTNGTTSTNTNTSATTGTASQSSNVLKIQITGDYMNVSDFIFELENDDELRFKLDNITMEYVGNNNIKTTFSIKNMVVLK